MFGSDRPRVEVTHISRNGFWLLLDDDAILVRFDDCPWFRDATIGALTDVEWPSPDRLYWPRLGMDLPMEMIRPSLELPTITAEARHVL